MKFSFAIAGYSLPDLETGKTMNQGDIIAYKPSGWEWGREEVKRFLIVEMEVENEEEAKKLCRPKYKDKTYEEFEAYEQAREDEEKAAFDKYAIGGFIASAVEKQYAEELKSVNEKYPPIEIEAQRQYNIDLVKLGLDIS